MCTGTLCIVLTGRKQELAGNESICHLLVSERITPDYRGVMITHYRDIVTYPPYTPQVPPILKVLTSLRGSF